jgi:hypothetical protein
MSHHQKLTGLVAAADADADTPKPDLTVTNDTKPFTDEELVNKITETMYEQAADPGQKIKVEVKKDSVITISTHSFATLEESNRPVKPYGFCGTSGSCTG